MFPTEVLCVFFPCSRTKLPFGRFLGSLLQKKLLSKMDLNLALLLKVVLSNGWSKGAQKLKALLLKMQGKMTGMMKWTTTASITRLTTGQLQMAVATSTLRTRVQFFLLVSLPICVPAGLARD
jgi:hypothetical protein